MSCFWRGVEWIGMKPLRCQSCSAQVGIGPVDQPDPDPKLVVVRCTLCAASEEAEAITKEASS